MQPQSACSMVFYSWTTSGIDLVFCMCRAHTIDLLFLSKAHGGVSCSSGARAAGSVESDEHERYMVCTCSAYTIDPLAPEQRSRRSVFQRPIVCSGVFSSWSTPEIECFYMYSAHKMDFLILSNARDGVSCRRRALAAGSFTAGGYQRQR